jgi:hypothetical protein
MGPENDRRNDLELFPRATYDELQLCVPREIVALPLLIHSSAARDRFFLIMSPFVRGFVECSMDDVTEYEYEAPRVLATYQAGESLAEAETSSVIIIIS